MLLDSTLRFNAVRVIESLPAGKDRTGEYLVDSVLTPAKYDNQELGVAYRRVHTARELLDELGATATLAESTGVVPVVHIEAHGDKAGLEVASGEHVPWPALKDALTRINASSGLHLLVVMAMCRGIYLSRILLPMEPAPAWGIIGPNKQPKPRDLYVAMKAFYEGLLVHGDGRRAIFDMNDGRPPEEWDFGFMSAEWLFCQSFRRYLEDATPAALRDRENYIVAELLRRRGSYDLTLAADARDRARAMLSDHRPYFDSMKHTFFMFDMWPENRDRFRLEYEECGGGGSGSSEVDEGDEDQ